MSKQITTYRNYQTKVFRFKLGCIRISHIADSTFHIAQHAKLFYLNSLTVSNLFSFYCMSMLSSIKYQASRIFYGYRDGWAHQKWQMIERQIQLCTSTTIIHASYWWMLHWNVTENQESTKLATLSFWILLFENMRCAYRLDILHPLPLSWFSFEISTLFIARLQITLIHQSGNCALCKQSIYRMHMKCGCLTCGVGHTLYTIHHTNLM